MALIDGEPTVVKGGIAKSKAHADSRSDQELQAELKKFLETYDFFSKFECAIHFRKQTHGEVNEDNTHPFKIGDLDIYLMHNGTLSGFTAEADKSKSDTWHYASLLEGVLKYGDILRDPKIEKTINLLAGSGNRLLFLDRKGFYFPNKTTWKEKDGIWYSNDYAIKQLNPNITLKTSGYTNHSNYDPKTGPNENNNQLFLPDGGIVLVVEPDSKYGSSNLKVTRANVNNTTPIGSRCKTCHVLFASNVLMNDQCLPCRTTSDKKSTSLAEQTPGTETSKATTAIAETPFKTSSELEFNLNKKIEEIKFKAPLNLEEFKALSLSKLEELIDEEPEMMAEAFFGVLQGTSA